MELLGLALPLPLVPAVEDAEAAQPKTSSLSSTTGGTTARNFSSRGSQVSMFESENILRFQCIDPTIQTRDYQQRMSDRMEPESRAWSVKIHQLCHS